MPVAAHPLFAPAQEAPFPANLAAEDLPTVEPLTIPSIIEILVRAYNRGETLEWTIIAVILRTVAESFPYFFDAKPLREWVAVYADADTLRDPPPEGCVPLATPALELKHPDLPKERTYLLVPGVAGRELYCVVVLDHAELAKAKESGRKVALNAFHISALHRGKLFLPEICKLIFDVVSKAALYTEIQVTHRISAVLGAFETQLRKLWDARNLTW